MKTFLRCPNCKARCFTRIGIATVISAEFNYSYDYLARFFYRGAKPRYPGYFRNISLEDLVKNKNLKGFWCLSCGYVYPKSANKRILKYFKNKKMLDLLKRK
ncbi:hypothetical protein KAW50_03460 [candidate division WOR-3 bacterium]|nr:hypothetical protein [candidate division WOR-3 bacterium]